MSDSNIIQLQDLLDSRALKKKELIFYNQQLDVLCLRLALVQKEIQVTKFIIKAIELEQILDLKDLTKR